MNSVRCLTTTLLVAAGLLAGCASLDPAPSFEQVRKDVAERTGREVRWNQGTAADAEVRLQVRRMLEAELTADQAVQIALLNNRRLQATYESLGIAQANLVQAGLLKNPIFEGSYRFDDGGGGDGVLEMQVVQDFLDILLIPMKKRLAESQLQRARLEVTGEVMDLAHRVRTAYVRLVASQQAAQMWRTTVEAAEASYDVAQRLHKAGNMTDLDLSGQRALYEQAKLDLAAAEAGVLEDRERLNALMGLWGQNTTWRTVAQLPDIPPDELDPNDLEKQAVARSVDLALARQNVQTAAASIGLDVAATVFQTVEGGFHAERDPGDLWQAGPMLVAPLPIFDQGQASSAAGKAEVRRRWEQYVALAVEVRAAARAARHRLVYTRPQALYYQQVMVPLRRQITAATLLQYNAMQVGVFDLLLAKQQEVEAERRALEVLRDYWIARSEMELILNGRVPSGALDGTTDTTGPGAHRSKP
jgi:cobalt-zinc-cadmium efflux system outer membrane protein